MTRYVGSRAPVEWERCVPESTRAVWTPQAVALGDGTETMAVVNGTGPTLLVIPPLVGWKESMWPQVTGLAGRFRVVAFDLRAGSDVTWSRLVTDVDRVVETLAPAPLALLGHSLGGALALQWAVARPGRVTALVLSSTYSHIRFDAATWWSRFAVQGAVLAMNRLLPEGLALRGAHAAARRGIWVYDPHCDDALMRMVRAAVRATPARVALQRVRLARAFDARPLLAKVRCPTLVMVGGMESPFARESAEILRGGIAGAELRVVPEANHLVHLSRAPLYNEIVAAWLDDRRAAGAAS